MLKAFYVIVDDIRRKPYDLLDYTKNTFDRDYLEFNVNIHDLDSQMQVSGWMNWQVASMRAHAGPRRALAGSAHAGRRLHANASMLARPVTLPRGCTGLCGRVL